MKTQIQYPEDYVVYDLETTGVDPKTAEITEIALLRTVDGITKVKSWLIKTKDPIPQEASDITGITNEMLEAEGIEFDLLLPVIVDMIGELPIVGHNITRYDNVILRRYMDDADINPEYRDQLNGLADELLRVDRCIDTAPMIKSLMMQYHPDWSSVSERMWFESTEEYNHRIMEARAWGIKWNLKASCEFLGIETNDLEAHRAAADVMMTDRLYRSMTGLS